MEKRKAVICVLLVVMVFLCPLSEADGACGEDLDCENGVCVPWEKACDKKDDCGNNGDENFCTNDNAELCRDGQFLCHNLKHCVRRNWLCDGENDCEDGSDEKGCPKPEAVAYSCTTTSGPTSATSTEVAVTTEATGTASPPPRGCKVEDGDFPCLDGRCLLPVQVCDGVRDCSDGADEGRFCQLLRRGNWQLQQTQQGPHWVMDLRMQFGPLSLPLLNSSNATSRK